MSRPQKNKHRRFVLLERQTLNSAHWQALTTSEMITYIYVKNNFNGGNNGQIPLKYVELKGFMAPATVSKALKGLQSKGWIEKTQHGGLYRYYCLYKLTGLHDAIK
jgi:DNA-binding MarR family transcriptional regulator